MRIEEKEYTKSIDLSIWKKIFPFLAPRKNTLIMVVLMNLLCSVCGHYYAFVPAPAIDSFIEKNTLSGLGGIYPFVYCRDRVPDVYGNLLYQRMHEN